MRLGVYYLVQRWGRRSWCDDGTWIADRGLLDRTACIGMEAALIWIAIEADRVVETVCDEQQKVVCQVAFRLPERLRERRRPDWTGE